MIGSNTSSWRARRTGRIVALGVLTTALGLAGCGATGVDVSSTGGDDVTSTTAAPASGLVSRADVDAALPAIDGIVQAALDATGVPGLSLALVHDDEVVFSKGYGVRKEGEPETVDADTVFQLASVSKSLSSTAVAALVGQEVISWDEPVAPHSPDFALEDPWVTDHVTFADLYSHRSGLPGNAGNSLEDFGYTRDEIIARLRYEPLSPFRATYSYSNYGLTVAGDAAARAANVSFEELMATRLFEPAGMTSASASYDDFLTRPNRATLHARIDGEWRPDFIRDPDAQAPAGGISSSVVDLATWMRLQLGGGTLDGVPIVEKAALDQTHTPHALLGPLSDITRPAGFYGLGWNVEVDHDSHARWTHSGAFTTGAATRVVLLPAEGLGIAVLTNGMPIGVPEAVADEVLDTIVLGEPQQDWLAVWGERFAGLFATDPTYETPPTDPAPAQPAAAYVGTYANPYYGDARVVESGDGLSLVLGPAEVTYALEHWDGDVFLYTPAPELPAYRGPVTFAVEPGGTADSVTVADLNATGLGVFTRV